MRLCFDDPNLARSWNAPPSAAFGVRAVYAQGRKEKLVPKENDLEGAQDQGGKHGGQAGMPKPPPRPKSTERDADVVPKGSEPPNKDK